MSVHKNKKRKHNNFIGFSRPLFDSAEWLSLSKSTMIAYLYFKKAYVGHNNGDIVVYYSQLRKVFGSDDTIKRCIQELIDKGWIEKVEQGGLYRHASKYALTFKYDFFGR